MEDNGGWLERSERERESNCCSRSTPGNSRLGERTRGGREIRVTVHVTWMETQLLGSSFLLECYTSNRVSGLFPNELGSEDDDQNEILG